MGCWIIFLLEELGENLHLASCFLKAACNPGLMASTSKASGVSSSNPYPSYS